ncbi:MAG: DnaJ C-terminal domain-containing protein [Burkholderiaceae bacterium]
MEFRDYYRVMNVARDASQDDIKRAYRKLARKYHPDVSKEPDAEQLFKELGEAYAVLSDPEKRLAYDQLGESWKAGQEFQPPPGWDQGFEFHGDNSTDGADRFSDFFENLFARGAGGSARHARTRDEFHAHGEDTHAKVLIDLEDAYFGASRNLTLKQTQLGADGRPRLHERTLNVQIPKGVRQGQLIRLAGQGSPGIGKGKTGDLYLEIQFSKHRMFVVAGRDVTIELPVAPWEAALGAKVNLPTPTGPVELAVPPGSAAGQKLRLKGRGIPFQTPGDLFAVLRIVLPPADTKAAKDAYLALQQAAPFNPRAGLGV